MSDKFSQPADIDDATTVFPGDVSHLMPAYADVSEKYSIYDCGQRTWANRLAADWFFAGLTSVDGLVAREGIDKAKALRHIATVMSSFQPKHEHKMAACAFLLDKWFDGDKSTWERAAA